MNKTGIEWCTYTWNCLRGCSWMSPGYDHCYAEQIARRFGHAGQAYEGAYDYEADSWSGQVFFFEHKLDEPQRVKAPQIVFANSMSDVCHPEVKPEWLDAIFYHMTAAERHWYMVLTKRPHLIAKKFWTEARADGEPRYYTPYSLPGRLAMGTSIESEGHLFRGHRLLQNWPGRAFLSMEPILSRVSIKSILRAD
jgi:protein gp37